VLLVDVAELLECVDARGISPFAEWRESGNFSAVKGVGAGVFELRLDFGPGYRVYFGKDGEQLVVLLGGGTKKRQQADIVAAQALWRQYRRTKIRRESDGHDKKV
jgi:putative addiction module killer protein